MSDEHTENGQASRTIVDKSSEDRLSKPLLMRYLRFLVAIP